MYKAILIFMFANFLNNAWALVESTKPVHPINSVRLATRVLKKTLTNTHYRVIGACLWLNGFPSISEPSPAIEQYLPDLIVTVSNRANQNPWKEVGLAYENKWMISNFEAAFENFMGMPFDVAESSSQMMSQHVNEEQTRIIHVIGSPAGLYSLPKITHKPETRFGKPYYSSHADAVSDRTEVGELIHMLTHPNLLINHEIGTTSNHWGHEVPRLMRVTQPSRFRASVVAAMHAADIVTNQNSGHVTQSTTNKCGPNCVISNVIYDPKHEKVIWQEVYPNNRNINPGDPNDFGEADDRAGNGNYIFVIWRKYRGCVKKEGKLAWSFPHVGKPKKR